MTLKCRSYDLWSAVWLRSSPYGAGSRAMTLRAQAGAVADAAARLRVGADPEAAAAWSGALESLRSASITFEWVGPGWI